MIRTSILAATALTAAALAFQTSSAYADHSWGNYHWERSTNPKIINLGDNLGAKWKPTGAAAYLTTASDKWNTGHPSYPKVIDTDIVAGKSNRRCKPTSGGVEVCSARYGFNGWLGLAQIWISGDHITKGIAKLNDNYFDTKKYNTKEWRNLVMCQEVAHTFGLDHQDETFNNANLGSCMDYTNNPAGNEYPNEHDFEQLADIYSHLDSGAFTVKSVKGFEFAKWVADDFEGDWGRAVAFTSKGQPRLFVKELGGTDKRITHVLWTEDAPPRRH